ncbi:MAG: hypothetical protein HC853_00340 [Anaerolineae bacterium]|nr:hypothetical protein [Anaerolineae bacterium]
MTNKYARCLEDERAIAAVRDELGGRIVQPAFWEIKLVFDLSDQGTKLCTLCARWLYKHGIHIASESAAHFFGQWMSEDHSDTTHDKEFNRQTLTPCSLTE